MKMCDKCDKIEPVCEDNSCGCLSEYSGGCIIYDGEDLEVSSIPVGLTFNETFKEFDEYLGVFKNEITNFLGIVNVGNGAKAYQGTNLVGKKLFRTLISSNSSLTILENTDDIEFRLEPASTTLPGIIEIATQAEVDLGLDTVKAVTPSTLLSSVSTILSNPSNLPVSSETALGVIEIATQAEVDAGTDNTRAVTPEKLNTYVADYVTDYVNTELSDPNNLPSATETQKGVIEIATQAEVDAGTDTERSVTPATLKTYVSAEFADSSNLPNATTTQRGIIEIATQAEVNALSDSEKAVTPATVPVASTAQSGISERATEAEVLAGTDNQRHVTPSTLQAKVDSLDFGLKTSTFTISSWSKNTILTPITHNIGGLPLIVQVRLVCVVPTQGYVAGDRVLVGQQIVDNQGGSVEDQGIAVTFNTTTITLIPAEVVHLSKLNTGSNAQENFNIATSDFNIEVVAIHT